MDRELQELALRVGRLESSLRRNVALLDRLQEELGGMTRAQQISEQVELEQHKRRLAETEQLSGLWLKLGVVALLVSTLGSATTILVQTGVL